jgi:glycosyltransferase involved in cell wall biosynthesis
MKVLALASYPVEAAATRYRLQQFVMPLAERGITLTISPFISAKLFEQLYRRDSMPSNAFGLLASAFRRIFDVRAAKDADVVLIQREAMIFGPPLVEWLMTRVYKRPMVLDLDDATYVSYTSPTYGSISKALKWFSKTDDLIRWSKLVICGNQSIADYAASKGARTRIIPTVVDTDKFRPGKQAEDWSRPVLGWVGSHSTFPYLESIFPVLEQLARSHRFQLRIVGSGRAKVSVPGVDVETLKWNLEREVEDFRSFDIGLYPLDSSDRWALGKSGFKAIQYMAVGIPYVATPIGAAAQIGEEGVTHFCASTPDEWAGKLESLLNNPERRRVMGAAGRRHVRERYDLAAQAEKLAQALRDAAN